MLNRSERFARLVLAVAKAPTMKRLVLVPSSAMMLYNALVKNPRWNEDFLGKIGRGSRLCCMLFRFVAGLVEITARQEPYDDEHELAATVPDWLRRYYDLQVRLLPIPLSTRPVSILI